MSIKTKMQELKKELILQEATKMFEISGYEQLKVSDLAKEVHVSVGTIYSLFSSKEGLYLAYIEQQIQNFLTELKEKTVAEKPYKKIYTFVELKFSYYWKKRKAIEQNAANNPFFFNTLAKEHSEVFAKIYLFLQDAFVELNPKINRQQAIRLSYALNGYSDGYIGLWLEKNDDLLQYAHEVTEFFIIMLEKCCK